MQELDDLVAARKAKRAAEAARDEAWRAIGAAEKVWNDSLGVVEDAEIAVNQAYRRLIAAVDPSE